jgi:pyruvate kinase
MDLAGPKLRTGDLRPGAGVIRIRPKRDAEGNVLSGRRLRFVPEREYEPVGGTPVFPVPAGCVKNAEVGDWVVLRDTRAKRRELEIVKKDDRGLVLDCEKTTYIGSRMKIRLRSGASGEETIYRIGELPGTDNPIILMKGDALVLHRDPVAGEPAVLDKQGELVAPAHIACRQPEVFHDVEKGAPIRFNDGKIEGTVDKTSPEQLVITVTRAKRSGSRLRADKGINFPGSDIKLHGLTEADRGNLPFVVEHADAVSLSFVRNPVDIQSLQSALREASGCDIGIIIKIETRKAFKDLPRLLLTAMRHYPAAVMIARGDLAVECGWERLAEIQEEILWMCEAAEMPVIWATQVLERETKSGQPSRAEITDAAMSQRADCVMLNKGPHIRDAIRMLDDILRRMQAHQHKKSPKLRRLDISDV